jgi:hypothetical protein
VFLKKIPSSETPKSKWSPSTWFRKSKRANKTQPPPTFTNPNIYSSNTYPVVYPNSIQKRPPAVLPQQNPFQQQLPFGHRLGISNVFASSPEGQKIIKKPNLQEIFSRLNKSKRNTPPLPNLNNSEFNRKLGYTPPIYETVE